MSAFTLYRFYDAENVLLYVGLSVNPGKRFEQHKHDKAWWNEVARVELEQYQDAETLRLAEREAIQEEHPRYNIRMAVRRQYRADDLCWICEECGKPIEDGDGYLAVSYDDLNLVRLREKDRQSYVLERQQETGHTLVAVPLTMFSGPLAHWSVFHRSCDPMPESDDYWIAIADVRSLNGLVARSSHLLRKRWIRRTDWHQVLADKANA